MDEREIILLELDREDAPEVVDLLQKKGRAVNEEIDRVNAELRALIAKAARIRAALEKFQPAQNLTNLTPNPPVVGKPKGIIKPLNGYKTNFTVWEKVQYVLRKEIEPITKRQIIERIEAFEPGISALSGKRRRQFSVSVSNILTTKSDKGLLQRVRIDGEENKYELKQIENE